MSIKSPSGVGTGAPPISQNVPATGAGPAKPVASAPSSATPAAVNPEAIAKALKDYQKIVRDRFQKPLLSGAAGLFTDSVVFPADLLDPSNPANDPRYLHLLSAVLGMKELEKFFKTKEQIEEDEEGEEDNESPHAPNSLRKKSRH